MALYMNGIFGNVIEEVLRVQTREPSRICFLQPYSPKQIARLAKTPPSPEDPVRLYISASDSLERVSYTAEIVGWEDKTVLGSERKDEVDRLVRAYQPGEGGLYMTVRDGILCTNLLSVRGMRRFASPVPVGAFTKHDGTALLPRSRPGGWAYVREQPAWVGMIPETRVDEEVESQFDQAVRKSMLVSSEERRARLEAAERFPKRYQVLSQGFARNPDVVAAVLARARGACERCGSPAPFIRERDGTPYLEVHHTVWLAKGGQDTVDNAIALCPNCHRELHFGRELQEA